MSARVFTAKLAACSLFLLSATAFGEDIYRWTDENGTVHFGSLPPQGVKAELVSSVPAPRTASDPGPAVQDAQDPALAPEKQKSPGQIAREERKKREQERQQEMADLAPQCAAMRQQVEEIEPHTRVIVQDEDGSVRRLEDEERLKAVADAKAFIAENCEDLP